MLHNVGGSRHTQNIQISKVIGANEKRLFYFTEKKDGLFGQPSSLGPEHLFLFSI